MFFYLFLFFGGVSSSEKSVGKHVSLTSGVNLFYLFFLFDIAFKLKLTSCAKLHKCGPDAFGSDHPTRPLADDATGRDPFPVLHRVIIGAKSASYARIHNCQIIRRRLSVRMWCPRRLLVMRRSHYMACKPERTFYVAE